MDQGTQSDLWGKVRVQIRRYFGVLKKVWWLIPLTVSAGMSISAWWVSQMPPAYLSVAQMMVSGQIQLNEGASYSEAAANFFGTQVKLMQSGEVQQQALSRVETLHPELPPEQVTYEVSQEPQTSIFALKVTAPNPVFAQAYLDACMDAYIDKKKQLRIDLSGSTTQAISSEMAQLDKEIEANDAEMLQFQRANNIGFLQEEGNSAAKYLTNLNQQLSDLQKEYNLLQLLDLDQNLDRQQSKTTSSTPDDGRSNTELTSFGPIAEYQKAKQQIAVLKAQRDDLSHDLKPKHPTIIDLDKEIARQNDLIAALRVQSDEALKTHREGLRLQIENLQDLIKQQETKALDLSSRLSEFDKLKIKAERTKSEYDRLLANFHSVDVTKNVDQDSISILERASQASSVKPGLAKIIAAGIGGGLLVGMLIVFIVDQMDDRISSLMELQAHFPEHLLGQIPQEQLDNEQEALLKVDDDRQALLESFRTLRSSIIFLPMEGKRPKTLVVTSSLPNEGKTTVASNLAVTLAFSGAKTLLVDADMRSGKLSHLFNVGTETGFSSVLQQKIAWTDTIYMTSIDKLFILPCGPALHHTAEHLLRKVTDQFLKDVYDVYDYVIFDSPPVIILDDTLSLAPKIDATLFVVRFNSSSVRASRRALELLGRRQANIIGLVCNGVTLSETEYNYNYNYRQYYGGKYAEVKANP
jgi:succinoglycan biosynthesis transport protein ExoP